METSHILSVVEGRKEKEGLFDQFTFSEDPNRTLK